MDWPSLLRRDGDELEVHYRHILTELGRRSGMLGVIFRKAQNRVQDPAKLRRLIVDLIDREAVDDARRGRQGRCVHGVVSADAPSPIRVDDALKADPGQRFAMVLTNPPFGKKSSVTIVGEDGEARRDDLTVIRDDFWASTSSAGETVRIFRPSPGRFPAVRRRLSGVSRYRVRTRLAINVPLLQ